MVRVRFAPSPTGHLHIGGARTALFNYLYTRHNNGKFILRIEDTDRTRSTEEFIDAIIEGMKWLKLEWDEGPFRQTDRFDVYKNYIEKLLKEGTAYYCYCSSEELEQRRQEALAQGKTPKYDGRCRSLKDPVQGRTPVVRFKMPQEGQTIVNDLIKGCVTFENNQLDDLIIMRSDGTPTYNFTVVVDDVDMKITHVIRGDDHLNNTPKQIHIYKALGYAMPEFAHLPMILGSDKARLSKRHGATSVMAYEDMGYLPDALVNYLVRLGWSYGDQEIFTKEELIKHFSFESIGKSSSVFNPEKLLWLNSQYMMNTPNEELAGMVLPFLTKEGIISDTEVQIKEQELRQYIEKLVNMGHLSVQWSASDARSKQFIRAVATLKERSKTLVELAKALKFYLVDNIEYNEKAKAKFLNENSKELLKELNNNLETLNDFSALELEKVFKTITEKHNINLGSLAQPVRVAVTGTSESPGIFEVLEILGKSKTISRLKKAIEAI